MFVLVMTMSYAQQGDGGIPMSFKLAFEPEIPVVNFVQPNIDSLLAEDAIIDGKGIAPWRFGYNYITELTLFNSGEWFDLPNGGKIWIMQVHCDAALTVNLTFQNSQIPYGNELFIYNPSKTFVLGRFVERHIVNGFLGTELVPESDAVIEYYVSPENISSIGNLEISIVTHGYRTAEDFNRAFGGSGSCNMNVNCPDGQPFQNQRNSAVMLVSGSSGFCSGALINNTANDGTPYVLTARHCGNSGFANWIFRFNWQADACNNPNTSPSFQSLSGSVNRAGSTNNTFDMRLLEITGGLENGTVPESYNPFFAGWDNSGVEPLSTFCIHHPSGDIKKIAFDDDPAVTAQYSTTPNNTWRVVWDRNTTTEPGSSGSPLFDQNGRIIGQLWGGGASCSNLSAPDYYGKVSMSWNPPGSTNEQQLKHWLDPDNTSILFLNGFPQNEQFVLDARLYSNFDFLGTSCTNEITPSIFIFNEGTESITTINITYSFSPNDSQEFTWEGLLPFGEAVSITLPTETLDDGNYTFTASVLSINGSDDENPTNNQLSQEFTIATNGFDVQLNLQLDCWGDEISWRLLNQFENQVLLTGGPYDGQDGELINESWCLAEACYVLEINDSYGDGFGGGFGCQTVGSLQIIAGDSILNEIQQSQANFGSQRKLAFCLGNATSSLDQLSLDLFEAHIFPNPTDGAVYFAFNMVGPKDIKIFTAQGAVVFVNATDDIEASFNMDFLTAGVYFVEIRFGGHIEIQKILKQ